MKAVWCPSCTRRLPDGTGVECPFCGHVGVVRGGHGRFRELLSDAGELGAIAVSVAVGLASACIALFGYGPFTWWPQNASLACLIGGVFAGFLSPGSSQRRAIVAGYAFAISFVCVSTMILGIGGMIAAIIGAILAAVVAVAIPVGIGSAVGGYLITVAAKTFGRSG